MRRKGTGKEGRREEKEEGKEAEGLMKEVTSRLNLPSLTMVQQKISHTRQFMVHFTSSTTGYISYLGNGSTTQVPSHSQHSNDMVGLHIRVFGGQALHNSWENPNITTSCWTEITLTETSRGRNSSFELISSARSSKT